MGESAGRCYKVWVDRLQGSIKRIERTDDNYSHDKVPISDEYFKRILNNLKEIAEKVSGLKCIYSDLNVEMIDDSYIDGVAGCCCKWAHGGIYNNIYYYDSFISPFFCIQYSKHILYDFSAGAKYSNGAVLFWCPGSRISGFSVEVCSLSVYSIGINYSHKLS